MDLELIADEENQYRAECGEYEAGGMESCIRGAGKYVADAAAHNRAQDAEHDRPEHRHVHVHDRFRDIARDQPDKNVPDQVKHTLPPAPAFRAASSITQGVSSRAERLKNLCHCYGTPPQSPRRCAHLALSALVSRTEALEGTVNRIPPFRKERERMGHPANRMKGIMFYCVNLLARFQTIARRSKEI